MFWLKLANRLMDRALPPVVLGASIGSWAWWRSSFVSNLQDTAVRVVLDRGLALVTLVSEDLRADHLSCFVQVTAVLIVVHYRRELHFFVGLAFRGASALGKLLVEVLECICALLSWWVQLLHWSLLLAISPREQDTYFTSSDMAVVAGPPVPIGSFVLLSRPPEWDEVMVGAFTDNYNLAICKTTNGIGDAWIWVLVRVDGLHMRLPTLGAHGERRAPGGIGEDDINWICTPPAGAAQWRPGAAEIPNIAAEANLILAQYNTSGAGWTVNVPGVAGPLVEIVAAGGGIPGPLAGGGGAAAAALPAGAGLGVGGGSPVGAQSQDLQALEAAVRDLQRMALSPGSRMSKSKKDKKKDRKKSSKGSKKKKDEEEEGQEAIRQQFQRFSKQQLQHIPVEEFPQLLRREEESSFAVEGARQGSCSQLLGPDSCRCIEAQAQRRPAGFRQQESGGPDSSFSGRGLLPAKQGLFDQDWTASRCERDIVGSPICWSHGDSGPQGGDHARGSAGLDQSKRDLPSLRHHLPADHSHPVGEAERRLVGKSGSSRTHRHPEVSSQLRDAGSHELLSVGLRKGLASARWPF